jgi:hypothetical protein
MTAITSNPDADRVIRDYADGVIPYREALDALVQEYLMPRVEAVRLLNNFRSPEDKNERI